MKLSWKIKSFAELNTTELYEIFQMRIAVFVVEQNCPYQDADGKDALSYHIMGFTPENQLAAYARILPAGLSFKEASIGRVITSSAARGTGSGKILMQKCLQFIEETFGKRTVRIGAQSYLKSFYGNHGFVIDSAEYLEDGIPHVEMVYSFPT
jgi:ElaA protein